MTRILIFCVKTFWNNLLERVSEPFPNFLPKLIEKWAKCLKIHGQQWMIHKHVITRKLLWSLWKDPMQKLEEFCHMTVHGDEFPIFTENL